MSIFTEIPTHEQNVYFVQDAFEHFDDDEFEYYFSPNTYLEGGTRSIYLTPSELREQISTVRGSYSTQAALLLRDSQDRRLGNDEIEYLSKLRESTDAFSAQMERCDDLIRDVKRRPDFNLNHIFKVLVWLVVALIIMYYAVNGFTIDFNPKLFVAAKAYMRDELNIPERFLLEPESGTNPIISEFILTYPYKDGVPFDASTRNPSIAKLEELIRTETLTRPDIFARSAKRYYIFMLRLLNFFATKADTVLFYGKVAEDTASALIFGQPQLLAMETTYKATAVGKAIVGAVATGVTTTVGAITYAFPPLYNVVSKPFGFMLGTPFEVLTAIFFPDATLRKIYYDFQAETRKPLFIRAPPAIEDVQVFAGPAMSPITFTSQTATLPRRAASRPRLQLQGGEIKGGAIRYLVRYQTMKTFLFSLMILYCFYLFLVKTGTLEGYEGAARAFDQNDLESITRQVLNLSDDVSYGKVKYLYAEYAGQFSEAVAIMARVPFPDRYEQNSLAFTLLRRELKTRFQFGLPWFLEVPMKFLVSELQKFVTKEFFLAAIGICVAYRNRPINDAEERLRALEERQQRLYDLLRKRNTFLRS